MVLVLALGGYDENLRVLQCCAADGALILCGPSLLVLLFLLAFFCWIAEIFAAFIGSCSDYFCFLTKLFDFFGV